MSLSREMNWMDMVKKDRSDGEVVGARRPNAKGHELVDISRGGFMKTLIPKRQAVASLAAMSLLTQRLGSNVPTPSGTSY